MFECRSRSLPVLYLLFGLIPFGSVITFTLYPLDRFGCELPMIYGKGGREVRCCDCCAHLALFRANNGLYLIS